MESLTDHKMYSWMAVILQVGTTWQQTMAGSRQFPVRRRLSGSGARVVWARGFPVHGFTGSSIHTTGSRDEWIGKYSRFWSNTVTSVFPATKQEIRSIDNGNVERYWKRYFKDIFCSCFLSIMSFLVLFLHMYNFVQGYPQRMKFKRRLNGIRLVRFLHTGFLVDQNCHISVLKHLVNHQNTQLKGVQCFF